MKNLLMEFGETIILATLEALAEILTDIANNK